MRRILGAAAALAALLCAPATPDAAAQSAPSPTPAVTMWGPDAYGPMARVGNTLYVGGAFDYVGPPTGSFAIVNAADASQINTAARLPFATVAVVPDGNGGWFALTFIANSSLRTPVHILPSGAVDPNWTAPGATDGYIDWIVVDGARLFIGGSFGAVGGATRLGIAALDAATGALTPWTSAVPARNVNHMFADSGVIYTYGFRDTGTTLALDAATGAAVPFATQSVDVAAASGNRLYGRGQCRPGQLTFHVCAYDRAGVALPTWVAPTLVGSENVAGIAADANHVFVLTGGTGRIAALDPLTGAELPSWTTPTFIGDAVRAIALDGGTLFVTGSFTSVNGEPRSRLAALDASSGAVLPWAPRIGAGVEGPSLAAAAGRVAVGGYFSSAGGTATKYLAALDLTTGLQRNVVPTATRPVTALVSSGDLVVVAEDNFAGGGEVFGFSAATGVKYPVTLPFSGSVSALEISGARLFIGGVFSFGGEPRRSLAAFDLAGAGLLPWNPGLVRPLSLLVPTQTVDPDVRVLRALAGRLYVGGRFLGVDGSRRGNGAAFDLNTLGLTDWDPRMENVQQLEFWQGRMLVSGGGAIPGNPFFRLRWVDPTSGDPLSLPSPQAPFTTLALTSSANTFIVGGQVDTQQGPGPTLVALDARTGQQLPWNVTIGGAAVTALGFDDLVVLRGPITSVGQDSAANLLVFRTTPPAPPRNLTFDATQPVVSMTWTAASGATPTAFVIEAGTAPGLGNLGRFPVGPVTQVSALVGPGAYSLRVFASGPTGTSAASSEILFTRPAPATPPNAPGALSGTVVAGVVALDWTASTDAAGYVIEAGSAAGLADIAVLPTGVLDTNAAGAVPAGTYFVRVRAANRFGLSLASNEVRLVVP